MSEQRRLAAIVSADVAGYSRLMGRDESGTLAALKALRREIVDPRIARHNGRIVKTTGDGLLLEFASVVDAVRCVLEVQTAVAEKTADVPEDRRIAFRTGINVGDIIIDGDDIFGDGVNVAARLQEVAEPGGISISSRVHEDIRDRIDVDFIDAGVQMLKNIARPLHVWHWLPTGARSATSTSFAVSEKPSIIVLPFLCPGGTPEQDALADGITESLITDLSRQSGFTVVARTTALTLKGKVIDVRELGQTMGVRYVLEGGLQSSARRLRINVQLISARDGIHLWADRFDKELGDLLDVEDEIAERISRAVAVQMSEAEIRRANDIPKGSQDAQTLFFLGRQAYTQALCRANCERAAALYAQAVSIDDRNALAHASLSIAKFTRHVFRWSDTIEAELGAAIQHRDRARSLDPNLQYTLVASAWILFAEHKFTAALAAFDRIARAAPLAGGNAFANLALAKVNVGRAAEAETELLRVIRVTPNDPQMDVWYFYLGVTYLYLGRYAKAVEALGQAIALNPDFDCLYVCLAAACNQLGKTDEARAAIRQAQTLGTRWTVCTLKRAVFSGVGVGIDDARMAALWDGLRSVGLPE